VLEQRHVPRILQPELLGDRGRHQRWIADRRQRDEMHSIRELVDHHGRQLDGQPRFAAAARAGQREQPVASQQPPQLSQLLFPTHEAGEGPVQSVTNGAGSTNAQFCIHGAVQVRHIPPCFLRPAPSTPSLGHPDKRR
jgi:hypothetical protein